jgi:hypothetical protein
VPACNVAADCEPIEDCVAGVCVTVPEEERECSSSNDCIAAVTTGELELTPCQVARDPFCQAGQCVIDQRSPGSSCSDGDTCTLDDACDENGLCSGTAVLCTAPQNPECVGGNSTLRSYIVPGQCLSGTSDCFYTNLDVACPNCSETCLGRCQAALGVYYPFLEADGVDRYTDNSGNNNYAECDLGSSTCPTNRLPGPVSVGANVYAVQFDGVDDRIFAADAATLDPVDFTLTAWIQLPGTATLPMAGMVVGKRDAASFDNLGYALQVAGDPPAAWCEIVNAGTSNATGSVELDLDRWYHLGCVYSSSANELRLFVDGLEETDATITTTITPPDTDGPLVVGGDSDQALTYPFEGLVDEVRLCNAVLEDVALCHLGGGFWDTPENATTWDEPGSGCIPRDP